MMSEHVLRDPSSALAKIFKNSLKNIENLKGAVEKNCNHS